VDEQKIKEAAYALWEKDGKPEGLDLEHWFKASKEVGEDVDANGAGSPPLGNGAGSGDDTTGAPLGSSTANSRKRRNAKSMV